MLLLALECGVVLGLVAAILRVLREIEEVKAQLRDLERRISPF